MGNKVTIKLAKITACFWPQATIDPNSGKPAKLPWMKRYYPQTYKHSTELQKDMATDRNEILWDGEYSSSHSSSDSEVSLAVSRRECSSKRRANKIRQTLDQYPKASCFTLDAKNFDEDTDDIEHFLPRSDMSSDLDYNCAKIPDELKSEGLYILFRNTRRSHLFFITRTHPLIFSLKIFLQ